MQAEQMISAHPKGADTIDSALVRCIEACVDCSQICASCADACLSEEMVTHLRQCIRCNLDCADICHAAGRIATRRTGSNDATMTSVLAACERACTVCADECERHGATMEHCRLCAEACRLCAHACGAALSSMASLH